VFTGAGDLTVLPPDAAEAGQMLRFSRHTPLREDFRSVVFRLSDSAAFLRQLGPALPFAPGEGHAAHDALQQWVNHAHQVRSPEIPRLWLALAAPSPRTWLLAGLKLTSGDWLTAEFDPAREAPLRVLQFNKAAPEVWTEFRPITRGPRRWHCGPSRCGRPRISRSGGPPPPNKEARTRPGWGSRGPQPGRHAGAAPLALWAKSVRKAANFTQWRPAPGKRKGADPTGLGLQGSPARSSVKRVAGRSPAGSRAKQPSSGSRGAAPRGPAPSNRQAGRGAKPRGAPRQATTPRPAPRRPRSRIFSSPWTWPTIWP
jgi:hypothetical protein